MRPKLPADHPGADSTNLAGICALPVDILLIILDLLGTQDLLACKVVSNNIPPDIHILTVIWRFVELSGPSSTLTSV